MADLNRNEPMGRKGSTTGSSMQREGAGGKMKEGWQDFKTNVRQKWNQLTDNDLDQYQNRDRNEFVGYVQNRTGGDRNAIERDVDDISRRSNYRWE